MKRVGIKILQDLGLLLAAIIVLVALLLYSIRFATPFLQAHHQQFEVWVGGILNQSVTIGKIEVDRAGINPEMRFQDVAIIDKSHGVVAHIDSLYVRIDVVNSLLDQRLEPKTVIVSGAYLDLYQNKDINLNNFANSSQRMRRLIGWLLKQGRIYLENISINWHMVDGKQIDFSKLRLQVINKLLTHKIVVLGRVTQPGLSWFRGVVMLRDASNEKKMSADGYLAIKNLDLLAWGKNFYFHKATVLRGYADSQTWFSWKDGEMRSLQTLLNLHDTEIKLHNKNSVVIKKFTANTLFNGDLNNGSIIGNYTNIVVNYAHMFKNPLRVNAMQGEIGWQRLANGWQVNANNISLQTDDLKLVTKMQLMLPIDNAGAVINLRGNYHLNSVAEAAKYYPVTIMSSGLVSWLDKAFVAGKSLKSISRNKKFCSKTRRTVFEKRSVLGVHEHSKKQCNVVLDKRAISRGALNGAITLRGNLHDFPFHDNNGAFIVSGSLNHVDLNYATGWPLLTNTNGGVVFNGKSMSIAADSTIDGVDLHNIVVKIPDLTRPMLYATDDAECDNSAAFHFIHDSPLRSSAGKYLNELRATGPMKLNIVLHIPLGKTPGSTHVSGTISQLDGQFSLLNWGIKFTNVNGLLYFNNSVLTSSGLTANLFDRTTKIKVSPAKLSFSGKMAITSLKDILQVDLANYANGLFDYNATLKLPANKFYFNSDLRGVVVHLPGSFTKLRKQKRKFHLTANFANHKATHVAVDYGKTVHASLVFANDMHNYSIKKIDFLRSLNLTVDALCVFGQHLLHAKFLLYRKYKNWILYLHSNNVVGVVTIPEHYKKQPIIAKFSKLYLSDCKIDSSMLRPDKLPAFNVVSTNFRYGNNDFNHVALFVAPIAHGLTINKLNLDNHLLQLSATGNWIFNSGKQTTSLYGTLDSNNIGALLKQTHETNNLIGGSGGVTFTLHWAAAPFDPKISLLNGNVMLRFANGSIVHLSKKTEEEIGLGRVLNLLSLQSLPRRLTLNFSDLTNKGFGFDLLKGNFRLVDGNAYTNDAFLDGSVAHIGLVGRIGLYRHDYDLILTMIPNVTSSLPILMTLAGGPVAGAVTWVADELFRHTLQPATAYKYKITGPWKQPHVVNTSNK